MEKLNHNEVNQSQPRAQPIPEEVEWAFRVVLSQGKGARPLYPTLTIPGCGLSPGRGVTLGEMAVFS